MNGRVSGSRIVWTDEMDAALKTGMRDGEPVFRLAPRLGVSQSACWKRARTKGWERPRGTHHRAPPTKDGVKAWTAEQLDELKDGCMAGDPFARIAPRVGFSEGACKDKAREMGWLPAGRLPSGANARQARRAWISTLAAALCIAVAPAWAQDTADLVRQYEEASAPRYQRVTLVTDGDNVVVSVSSGGATGWRVRLLGINAPEKTSKCRKELEDHVRATSRLSQLVAGGVEVQHDLVAESYGRPVARIINKERVDVGRQLVIERLVRPYNGKTARPPWCSPEEMAQ